MRRRGSSLTDKTVKFAARTGVKIIENTSEILTQQSIIQQYPSPPSPPASQPSAAPSQQIKAQIDEKPSYAVLVATPLRAASLSPSSSPISAPTEPEKHSPPPTVLPPSPLLSPTPTSAPLAPMSPSKCAKNKETHQQRPSRIPRPVHTPTSPVSTAEIMETAHTASPAPATTAASRLSPHATPFSPQFAPTKQENNRQPYMPPHRRPYMTISELFKKFGSSWSHVSSCSVQKQPMSMQQSKQSESVKLESKFISQSERSNINCAKFNSATPPPHTLPPRPPHTMQYVQQQKTPSHWPGSLFRQSSMAPRKSLETPCEKCGYGVIQTLMDALLQLLEELRHYCYGPRIV